MTKILKTSLLISLVSFWIVLVAFHTHTITFDEKGIFLLQQKEHIDHWLAEDGSCVFNISRNSDLFASIPNFQFTNNPPLQELTELDVSFNFVIEDYHIPRSERAPPLLS